MMQNKEQQTYQVRINIAEQISEQTGIPKEKVAEFLADEIMRLLGFNK